MLGRLTLIAFACATLLGAPATTSAKDFEPGEQLFVEAEVRSVFAQRSLNEAPAVLAAIGHQAAAECLYEVAQSATSALAHHRIARALLRGIERGPQAAPDYGRIEELFPAPDPDAALQRHRTCAALGRLDYRPAYNRLLRLTSQPREHPYPAAMTSGSVRNEILALSRRANEVDSSLDRLSRHPEARLRDALLAADRVVVAGLPSFELFDDTQSASAEIRDTNLSGALLVLPSARIASWRLPSLESPPKAIWILGNRGGVFPRLNSVPRSVPVVRSGASATTWKRLMDQAYGSGAPCAHPCDSPRDVLAQLRDVYGITDPEVAPADVTGMRPKNRSSRQVDSWHRSPGQIVHGSASAMTRDARRFQAGLADTPLTHTHVTAFAGLAVRRRQQAIDHQVVALQDTHPTIAACLDQHLKPALILEHQDTSGSTYIAALEEMDRRIQTFRACAHPSTARSDHDKS